MKKPVLSAIILSAGLSSRLEEFKPLLPLGEKRILERVIRLYQSVNVQDIRVVTGHRADEAAALVESCGATPVFNPDFAKGMYSSVVTGVSSLSRDCAGFFIHPVDIPLVRRQTLIDLQNAFITGNADIYYPTFLEVRGHPPLISGIHMKSIETWTGPGGLHGFLNDYQTRSIDVPVVDEFILKDIDTPEDYVWANGCLHHYDIPSDAECRALMIRQNTAQNVIDHCSAVADLSMRIARALNAAGCRLNEKWIISAARVHDLARNYPRHASEGARLLREMGFSRIADIVEVHMDFMVDPAAPITEAEVVFLADKWIQEDRNINMNARFEAKISKYGTAPDARREIRRRQENAIEVQHRIESLLGFSIDEL
jgi:molybdenum cofactor cytidylyltransferase